MAWLNLEETKDTSMSGASGEDGPRFPGVAGAQPANTGGAVVDPVADASKLPSKSEVCTIGVYAGEADRSRC